MSSVSSDDLVADLRRLRKGEGLTPVRLQRCSNLRQVLGQIPLDDQVAALIDIVDGFAREGREGQAVRNALGVDANSQSRTTLEDRRGWLISRVGGESRSISRAEDRGFLVLADRLLSRMSEAREADYPQESQTQLISKALLFDSELVVEQQDRVHTMHRRSIWRVQESITLRAKDDDVTTFRIPYKLRMGPFTSELRPVEVNGPVRIQVFESAHGWSILSISFAKLNRGQRLTFSYAADMLSRGPSYPMARVYVEQPTELLRCAVRLHNIVPQCSWTFQHSRATDDESRTPKLIRPDANGVVAGWFSNLYKDVECGIIWDW